MLPYRRQLCWGPHWVQEASDVPMDQDVSGPWLPIFVVLPHADARATAVSDALAPLAEVASRAMPIAAELYFSAAKGTALVALHFDPRLLTVETLAELAAAAARGNAAVVDPAR